jgi:hypothetical protein
MSVKSISKLNNTLSTRSRRPQDKSRAIAVTKSNKVGYVKNLFNQFQLDWINDDTPLCVYEKSRRIGASFAESYRAFRDASRGVCDTTYTSYNLFTCKKFIDNCGKWSKAFNNACKQAFKIELIDENLILTFSITFPNGRTIIATPADPKNLRDKEGVIVIDEAAFRRDLAELLKSALAIIMRGGKVRVLSTHYGKDNDFNKLCRDVESGEIPGSLHRTTFKQAIAQGMYKSMLAIRGEEWTLEKEFEWEKQIRQIYKNSAEEELDTIPSSFKNGQIFRESDFEYIDIDPFTLSSALTVCYFDLAATSEEKAQSKNKKAYYSAFVKVAIVENMLIVIDAEAIRLDPAAGDSWMENVIKTSSQQTIPVIEEEPGSTGMKFYEYFKDRISRSCGKEVETYKPTRSKILRALPTIPMIRERNDSEFRILIASHMKDKDTVDKEKARLNDAGFVTLLCQFDGSDQPLINDLTDCFSGAIDHIQQRILKGF